MGRMVPRERELDVDLEIGGTAGEEDRTNDHVCDSRWNNKLVDRSGFGPSNFERAVNSFVVEEVHNEDLALLIGRRFEGEEGQHHAIDKRQAVDKPKTRNTKKASKKPPRPPKGPMLDAVDQKLMQEIAELAMRKRARIERLKALKKRATKSSSWNSSLTALVITVLFCLILVFQAVCSRNNGIVDMHVSPRPAVAGGDLVSVRLYNNYSPDESDRSASDSPIWTSSRVSGSASSRKA